MVGGLPSFHSVTIQEKAEGTPLSVAFLFLISSALTAAPRTFTAKYEIVLCAGAFGTPALLQLSGIGDKSILDAAGITTIVHNPSVGRNMSDHTLVPLVFFVNETQTFEAVFRDDPAPPLAEWQTGKTGPLTRSLCNHLGWFRLPSTANIWKTTSDPAAGLNASHYELIFLVSSSLKPPSFETDL